MNQRVKAALLFCFFALCGAGVIATSISRARLPAPAARELYSVVNHQLSSLRADDFDAAYKQAASVVQQKFSRAQFEQMIRRDFACMTQAGQVEFGTVEVAGPTAMMQVYLTTTDGTARAYLYSFTAEQKDWKIDGVTPLGPQPARRLPGLHI
ncbi:MAG TPA: DUF4864 domain-containing protein [Chthoniobacterales bacterium]|jgi:hypothetical protein